MKIVSRFFALLAIVLVRKACDGNVTHAEDLV